MRAFALASLLLMSRSACSQATGLPEPPPKRAECKEAQPEQPCLTAPEPVFAPDPKYSKEGRRRKIEGTVNLSLMVGTDGMASQIKVAKPLGHGLDEEAVKCVEKWRFKPATFDGKPVAVQVSVLLDFHLIR